VNHNINFNRLQQLDDRDFELKGSDNRAFEIHVQRVEGGDTADMLVEG
jgi:hypothetical protein